MEVSLLFIRNKKSARLATARKCATAKRTLF